LVAFSSSQADNKYIIQLNIKAKTAKTATICINSQIIFAINFAQILLLISGAHGFIILPSTHQGSQIQFISGAAEYVVLNQNEINNINSKTIILLCIFGS